MKGESLSLALAWGCEPMKCLRTIFEQTFGYKGLEHKNG